MKNIKTIIFSLAALMVSLSSYGQHYIGIKGGAEASKVRFWPAAESKITPIKPTFGVMFKYYTAEKFVGGIEFDLNYVNKGYKYTESKTSRTMYTRSYRAIEMPMMWQPHVYLFNQHVRFYVNAGVYLSYFLNADYENFSVETGESIASGEYKFSPARDNRLEYGLCGGSGLNIIFGRLEFMVQANYVFGYSDIIKNRNKNNENKYLRTPIDQMGAVVGIYYRLGSGGIRSEQGRRKVNIDY